MGASSLHPIFLAFNELFRSIKGSTLERFLEECDTIAPWFMASGNLTVPSWEKLGRDLDFATEQGMLRKGGIFIWFELPRPPEFAMESEQLRLQGQGALGSSTAKQH